VRYLQGLAPPLLGAVTLMLAGCGGSSPTKSDVIARGNAICAGALRQVRATPAPPGGTGSLTGLSDYVKQVLPIVSKEISNLRALPRPSQDGALLNRYIAAVAATKSDYGRLAAAARNGDSTGASEALAALQASPAPALAKRYGLTVCAGGAGTSVS
jgi:hypothetical protein